MQFYKTYRYEEQIEKAILNKHENNYTSKVEKMIFITILIDATLTSPKKNDIFICLCV